MYQLEDWKCLANLLHREMKFIAQRKGWLPHETTSTLNLLTLDYMETVM